MRSSASTSCTAPLPRGQTTRSVTGRAVTVRSSLTSRTATTPVAGKEVQTMQQAAAKAASPMTEKPPTETRASPPRSRPSPTKLSLEGRSQEARLMAAVILEVLAGVRTPTDAAAALGVSLPRYYALEVRALEGLLRACERRPRGRRLTAEREVGKLRREVERLNPA